MYFHTEYSMYIDWTVIVSTGGEQLRVYVQNSYR